MATARGERRKDEREGCDCCAWIESMMEKGCNGGDGIFRDANNVRLHANAVSSTKGAAEQGLQMDGDLINSNWNEVVDK